MRFRSRLPSVGMILSALGLPLALLGWTLAPRKRFFFASMFGAFVGLLLTFVFMSSIAQALRRFARRAVSSRARRLMVRVAKRAPYTIQYELADGVLLRGARWGSQNRSTCATCDWLLKPPLSFARSIVL